MGLYDSLFSQGGVLIEQIARQVFDILPEGGPVLVITDKEGNFWPSDSERFAELNLSESYLKEVCAKVDDGVEPVVSAAGNCSIVAVQLATERTNCGYVIVALQRYSPESTLANIDIIEMFLNQIGLIARLIEKNNLLYELQMKQISSYSGGDIATN